MAFVSSFIPAFARPATSTIAVSSTTPPRGGVMMAEKSPAIPFMNAPPNLSSDMPGYVGFDPFNISSFLNVKWLQEAEIKHGRVCMLAFVGFLFAEIAPFPFYSDFPRLTIYRHDWGVNSGPLTQVLLWTSFFEIMTLPAIIQMVTGQSKRAPGDFGFDPLGLGKDPSKLATYKTNEVKNGRLAMIAVSGVIHHAAITNQNLVEQLTSGNVIPNVPKIF